MRVALFTVERQARVDVLTRFLGQTAKPPYRPCGVVRLQQDLRVIEFASEPEEIRRNPVRPIKPTPGVIELSTRWRWTARGRLSSRSPPNLGGTLHRFAHLRGGPSVKPTRRPRLETVRTLVSLLYQKGRDSRIFQAQDRAIDDFTLRGEALAGVYWPAGGARRRRSKLRQRRRAAGTLGLYRRLPSQWLDRAGPPLTRSGGEPRALPPQATPKRTLRACLASRSRPCASIAVPSSTRVPPGPTQRSLTFCSTEFAAAPANRHSKTSAPASRPRSSG